MTRPVGLAAMGVTACAVLLLCLPSRVVVPESDSAHLPFRWDSDETWSGLEQLFVSARSEGCREDAPTEDGFRHLDSLLAGVTARAVSARDTALAGLERGYMLLAARVAACPTRLAELTALQTGIRQVVKRLSTGWDLNEAVDRDRLYRLLYGTRAALEEALLQNPGYDAQVRPGIDEPSAAPGALIHGVMLRSGDILVSRGGYPTSALIARGSDHPGNFSHVGLVHVDPGTREVSVIEAHIESGVSIATAERYLADKKLRLMALRLRHDLPALQADPDLPHRAATEIRDRARSGHIPYDFAMDYRDPGELFCSEVASSAYQSLGVDLWMKLSRISGTGVRRWLASFGVRHFETQEPSDLEYDPQLVVVAEWHDQDALRQDHIDNAVTDVMLEQAEQGADLEPRWWQWPLGRLAKGYSMVLNGLGKVGPIPEGMSAGAALRSRVYTQRHAELAARVETAAVEWQAANGYPPPYWRLVEIARSKK